MNKIVKFPVEITDKNHVKYLNNEYKEAHKQMLQGASIECYFQGQKVILEKKNRNNLDPSFATKTTIKKDKLKALEDLPSAYMFHQYCGFIIPLWKVELED